MEFEHPETLLSILDLELSNEPCDEERLLDTCRQIIDYSVKTGRSLFPLVNWRLFSVCERFFLSPVWT